MMMKKEEHKNSVLVGRKSLHRIAVLGAIATFSLSWFQVAQIMPRVNEHLDQILRQEEDTEKIIRKEQHSRSHRPPIAIVHAGPFKTGSTAIQSSLQENGDFFAKENIYVPLNGPDSSLNLYGWSRCLFRDNDISLCNETSFAKEESMMLKAAEQKQDIIMSSETLSNPRIDVKSLRKLLEQILTGYEIHIIVIYRRHFSQFVSSYGQSVRQAFADICKATPDRNKLSEAAAHLEKRQLLTMSQQYEKDKKSKWSKNIHASEVVHRYKRNGFHNISVINMHEHDDIVEAFYCHEIVRTITDACAAIRDGNLKEGTKTNIAMNHDYRMIAVAAHNKGLIDGTKLRPSDASPKVEAFWKNEIALSSNNNLPKRCLSDSIVNELEASTTELEQELLPNYLNKLSQAIGATAIHDDIERAKAKFKFCQVDVSKVLTEPRWVNFFERDFHNTSLDFTNYP